MFDSFVRYKKVLVATGVALLALSFILVLNKLNNNVLYEELSLWVEDEKVFVLEVADRPLERQRGLSFRESLATDAGMLFVFEKPDKHGIWMKDVSFPLDIVWLDESFRVVNFKKDVSPDTFPTVFISTSPALYVIEANAGFIDQFSIKIGEILDVRKELIEM